jgi:hypothetical protein
MLCAEGGDMHVNKKWPGLKAEPLKVLDTVDKWLQHNAKIMQYPKRQTKALPMAQTMSQVSFAALVSVLGYVTHVASLVGVEGWGRDA